MRPSSIRRQVVLPAPFGPSSPHTCPRSTVKLRSSTASTPAPKRFERPTISTTAFGHRSQTRPEWCGGSTAASVAWPPMGTSAARRPARRATTPGLPGRDAASVEPTPRSRRVRPLRRPGRRHALVARALPRPRPRARPAPATRQRCAPGILPRRGRRPDHHAAPPIPHEGRGAPRAHALGARDRLRAPPPRAHVRTRAARRHRRVLRPRPRRGARGVVQGARRARRRVRHASGPTAACTTDGTNACASARAGCSPCRHVDDGEIRELSGTFDGYERGASVLRFVMLDGNFVRHPDEGGLVGARCRLKGRAARSSPRSSPTSGSRSRSSPRS